MNLADVLQRTDFVLHKYEKYMADAAAVRVVGKSADPFQDAYSDLIGRINDLNLRADEATAEKNRAVRASLNAEIRRTKTALAEQDLSKLERLVRKSKGLSKGLTPQILEERADKVRQCGEGIAGVPDGMNRGTRTPIRPLSTLGPDGRGRPPVALSGNFDSRAAGNPDYYKHTDASLAFQREWELAKARQDRALGDIEKGLGALRGVGEAMGENLNQQDVLLGEIDAKMDKANEALKTNNMKLKGMVTKMRSSRNFCLDVILLVILLGVAIYIYDIFKKPASTVT